MYRQKGPPATGDVYSLGLVHLGHTRRVTCWARGVSRAA